MKHFELFTAKDSADAVALLAQHSANSKVRIIAGGTDMMADLKFAPLSHVPDVVVDISRAQDLKHITVTDRGLVIGSLVTHTEIMRSPVIRDLFPALQDAAHTIGAVQTRNLGTVGGNLVTGVPSMDSGPTLVALEAIASIAGPGGRREVPLADFWTGPRRTVLKPDELLAELIIPKENLGKPTHFIKFGLRKGQALSLVNVAASFRVKTVSQDGFHGSTTAAWDQAVFVAPRIALGAVAPKVVRALKAEAFLEGKPITPENMAEAGQIAVGDCKPISDFRASADYRKDLVAILTRRALEGAYELAKSKAAAR
jgi:CO/xanthine dehydrogenase FAD-binding subunit